MNENLEELTILTLRSFIDNEKEFLGERKNLGQEDNQIISSITLSRDLKVYSYYNDIYLKEQVPAAQFAFYRNYNDLDNLEYNSLTKKNPILTIPFTHIQNSTPKKTQDFIKLGENLFLIYLDKKKDFFEIEFHYTGDEIKFSQNNILKTLKKNCIGKHSSQDVKEFKRKYFSWQNK